MRNCILLCLALIGAVLLMWLVTEASKPGGRVKTFDVGQIKNGMTIAEVIDILGAPPGDYTSNKSTFNTGDCRWISNEMTIVISFDESRRVRNVQIDGHDHGWRSKFFRWVGL